MQKDISYSCPEYLIAATMGYEKPVVTWLMKHGINTKIHAEHKCKSLTRRFHKNMTYNGPGMTVFEEYPYLSATPGLVEIKCLATIIDIEKDGDNLTIRVK